MKKMILLLGMIVHISAVLAQTGVASAFDVDGLKVIYKPTTRNVISVNLYFRGGVNNYDTGRAGIERLAVIGATECGTSKYSPDEFKDKSELFGIMLNGNAGMDYSTISLNCVSKYFDQGWELFAEAVTHPVFSENAFEKMKQRLISATRNVASNPDGQLRTLALKASFEGTPYAINPNGSEATLSPISATQVKQYFETLLNKNRMFLVVVGNISKQEITTRISAVFGSVKAAVYQAAEQTAPLFLHNTVQVQDRTMSTNYILGIMNAPHYTSDDFFPFQLAISELYGLLFSEIRLHRSLSYAPNAALHASIFPYSEVYVSTTNPKEAVQVIVDIINKMKKGNIARRSLEEIKALYITANYRREESTDAMAESLGRAEVLGDWSISENMGAMISKVTRTQMSQAFSGYIKGISWTYLGDKRKADEAMEAFQSSIEQD